VCWRAEVELCRLPVLPPRLWCDGRNADGEGKPPMRAGNHVRGPQPQNICVRAPNWVGDVVMATAAFRALRTALPGARIVLVIRETVAAVLRGAPWFDQRIVIGPGLREWVRAVLELRRAHCELGLILPNSFSSALMFGLGGVRTRVGYARDMRSPLLSVAVQRPSRDGRFTPTYMARYYLRLCEAAGLEGGDERTELPVLDEDLQGAGTVLRKAGVEPGRPLFLLHPGAAFGPSKLWPVEHFARLAELLQQEFGAQIACIGSPEAGPLAERIAAASTAPVVNLTGRGIDLALLRGVVAMSRLLVSTDSGPRHYGIALGIPTVCVMGPTHPAYSTSGRPHDHVVRLEVDCGPCQRKRCPRDHRCMRDLTPEMAFEACRAALRSQQAKADD